MSMPAARASISTRSLMSTISWSRKPGDSSRRPSRATTKITRPTTPDMTNWSCHGWRWGRVWLATSATINEPITGPMVQKPMAEARPSWGEKSRTRAGVATRTIPSTNPRADRRTPYAHRLGALGSPKRVSRAVRSSP